MAGYSNAELLRLVGELRRTVPIWVQFLKREVQTHPIIYGTAGKEGGAPALHQMMARSINNPVFGPVNAAATLHRENSRVATDNYSQRAYGSFQSGARGGRQRAENLQMMDMWYGDGHLGERANPTILQFIKYAAKLAPLPSGAAALPGHNLLGPSHLDRSGHPYHIYERCGVKKGWVPHALTTAAYGLDEFRGQPMTATKELSRLTRWLVGYFGGKIIFDAKDVYYAQVFDRTSNRFGDTEMEATALLPHVVPGGSSGTFGDGDATIEFEWDGKPVIPSKLLFMTSWHFDAVANAAWARTVHANNFAPPLRALVRGRADFMPTSTARTDGGMARRNALSMAGYEQVMKDNPQWGRHAVLGGKADVLDAIDAATRGVTERALWEHFPKLPPTYDAYGLAGFLRRLDGNSLPMAQQGQAEAPIGLAAIGLGDDG